jgi:hypothetical protein
MNTGLTTVRSVRPEANKRSEMTKLISVTFQALTETGMKMTAGCCARSLGEIDACPVSFAVSIIRKTCRCVTSAWHCLCADGRVNRRRWTWQQAERLCLDIFDGWLILALATLHQLQCLYSYRCGITATEICNTACCLQLTHFIRKYLLGRV